MLHLPLFGEVKNAFRILSEFMKGRIHFGDLGFSAELS
jgi:hypothetical protein